MVAITNFSTLTAVNTANNSKNATNVSVKRIATGKAPDFGQRGTVDAQVRSFQQGARNLAIHAGRYEAFAGIANSIVAVTQHKLEIAAKFSQTGFDASEYQAAGSRYVALDNYIPQLLATPPIGSGNFNAIKTDGFASGSAVVAGPATRAWQRAANSATVTGIAAAPVVGDINSAAEFAAAIPILKQEVANTSASAEALSGIAQAASIAGFAAAEEASGYIAISQALSTDLALETARMATNKIFNEAATAMVAQAGQMEQVMLKLLN